MERRQRLSKKNKDALNSWSIEDTAEVYGVGNWGQGLFSINDKGHACLCGSGDSPDIDLKELMSEIRSRGLKTPVLIRFTDILRNRLEELHGSFAGAFMEAGYQGKLRGVYPIKVNQHRHILEDMVEFGRPFNFGLEAGSKPELLLAISHMNNPESLLVCNGFKDTDYIEAALRARQLGHKIFIVIERPDELPLVIDIAKKIGVEPLLGIRMKLASRGKGMWESSGGSRSKFGLTSSQIMDAVTYLKRRKKLDCLQLLHFHIGSQITDIQRIKSAIREAGAFYAEIRKLGAPVEYLDVGGGLAVDYDGSHTNFASSANYGIKEYASDIAFTMATICTESGQPHPNIVTECGRAMTAHHSLLVVEAMAYGGIDKNLRVPRVSKKAPEILKRIKEAYDWLSAKNFQEVYHDAVEARREALMLFNLRHLSLADRAKVEDLFWIICRRIARYAQNLDYLPDELEGIKALASTIYYCNFSIFQSVPDHWALKQLFPVMPLQRLDEKPEIPAILGDITCDSDGVMDKFVDLRDVKDVLHLHTLRKNENYDIGIFLVGAYQAILGDLHNLFGDITIVHVSSGSQGHLIDRTIEGDRIRDVLGYVEFGATDILGKIREQVDMAINNETLTPEDAAAMMLLAETLMDGSTYLDSLQ